MSDSPTTFQFGVFEFDTGRQELRKRGHPLRLPVSQIRLLMLFLEQPKGLIRREAITRRLWDDPGLVDVEGGINTAVNRLRTNLGDDPLAPKYIATVVGLGYKFIADVNVVEKLPAIAVTPAPPAEVPLQAPVAPPDEVAWPAAPPQTWGGPALALLGGMVLVLLTMAVAASLRTHSALLPQKQPPIPSVSEQVVTNYSDDTKVITSAISPDGQMVAYSKESGISLLWPATRKQKLIAAPEGFDVQRISWFPDQQRLVASGIDKIAHQSQVWTLSLLGEPPRLFLKDASLAILSSDGRRIAFLRNEGHEIWVADSDGRQLQRLQEAAVPDSFAFLLWSVDGRWLVVEHFHRYNEPGTNTPGRRPGTPLEFLDSAKRGEIDLIEASSGRIADRQYDRRLDSGYMLRDGRLLYTSTAGGTSYLMAQPIDLRHGRFAGDPATVGSFGSGSVMSLSGSADGRSFAVLEIRELAAVMVANLNRSLNRLGPVFEDVHLITHSSLESYPHAWTPAGDAVLLEDSNTPFAAIYEQKTDGSNPALIAQLPTDAAMGEFTPDGRWVLFMGFPKSFVRPYGVFRVPAAGGTPEQLNTPGIIDEFHCSVSSAGSCILRESEGTTAYIYYALDPLKGLGKELGRTPWQASVLGDWSVSPDGAVVAVANHDPLHPSIQLVDLRLSPTRITEIPVEGFGAILEPTWLPDGRGLYIETKTEGGFALLYYALAGHATLLQESSGPIWAVPTRDGKKVAYPGVQQSTNIWVGTIRP